MTAISRNIPANEVFLNMNPDLPSELLAMEERQVIRSYKFGVAYCKDGQCTEEDMFANTHGTILILCEFIVRKNPHQKISNPF